MKIQRSQLKFRRRNRRSGCVATLTVVISVLLGVLITSWGWLNQRLNITVTEQSDGGYGAAQRAFDKGDLDGAVNMAKLAWLTIPNHTDALSLLVRSLIYRSYSDYNHVTDRKVALQITEDAMERLPNNLDVMAIHAFVLQANNQSVEAVALAKDVLRYHPDNTIAMIALSLAYHMTDQLNNALNISKAALEAGDFPVDAMRARAVILNSVGRYEDAIAILEESITLNNKLSFLHFEQAKYAMRIQDANQATVDYMRVLAFDPDNVQARLRLCELSGLLGEREKAIEYCQEVVRMAPSWIDGWYRLGREYFLQGNFSSAQLALNRCTTLSVTQNIPIEERPFECWYLQGQAAEIRRDCDTLIPLYNEFQQMSAEANLAQTWVYPPEGPMVCIEATAAN